MLYIQQNLPPVIIMEATTIPIEGWDDVLMIHGSDNARQLVLFNLGKVHLYVATCAETLRLDDYDGKTLEFLLFIVEECVVELDPEIEVMRAGLACVRAQLQSFPGVEDRLVTLIESLTPIPSVYYDLKVDVLEVGRLYRDGEEGVEEMVSRAVLVRGFRDLDDLLRRMIYLYKGMCDCGCDVTTFEGAVDRAQARLDALRAQYYY